MILQRLDLKAFGLFTDVSIDLSASPKRFHIVYGPNESGKSTSLRAITALLFGMRQVSEDNYLHPNTKMRVGGLLLDHSGRTLECVRRRGRKATLRDAADDRPVDEEVIAEMIGGVDRDTFLTQFGLSHQELTEGGAAILQGDGDLGELLFAAGAGVGKLREIQLELDEAGRDLFSPRGSKRINTAIKELDEQRKELRRAQLPPAEFNALRQKITGKREQSEALNRSLHGVAVELGKLRSYQQAMPLVPRWRSDTHALAELKHVPILDEGFTERRRQIESDRQLTISQHAEQQQRLSQGKRRVQALPEDATVIRHAAEIQSLFQEVSARDKADRDRVELLRLQKHTDRKIADLLRELSIQWLTDDPLEREELIEDSVQRLRISDAVRSRVHELAAKYERLVGQRDDARDEVETLQKRLADLSDERERIGVPADPTTLAGVIDTVGAPAAILELLSQQQDDCDQLRGQCESLAARLEGFQGTFNEAARLQPPDRAEIERVVERIRRATDDLQAIDDRVKELRRERDQADAVLHRGSVDLPLPTVDQLHQARGERDRLIDELSVQGADGVPWEAGIQAVRQKVQQADQIVDTLRLRHQEVHQRSVWEEKVRTIDEQIQRQQENLDSTSQELERAQHQWAAMWRDCGIDADSPDRMRRWFSDHEQLCQAVGRFEEEGKRLAKIQQQIKRACGRLRSAIESVAASKAMSLAARPDDRGLFQGEADDDLIVLHDEAVALRGELLRIRQQYDAVTRRHDELAEELPMAETRLATFHRNVSQWQHDWHRATDSFADSGSTPTVVMSMLRRIDELCDKKRERDILATRIRSIGEDNQAFSSRVRRVAEAVGEISLDGGDDGSIVQTLYGRLQSERTAARQRETLSEQIEEAADRAAELDQKRQHCDVLLKQLVKEAGCDDASELPEIERRSRRRQQLESSLRDLHDQLTVLAGDQEIEAFLHSVQQQEPALLDVEVDRKDSEMKELRERLSTIDQEIGALQHELRLMDGSRQAADLSQSIQLLAAGIGRDAEEFARLKVASLLLQRAIDHYRRENQSPVLQIAERVFAKLTCGEYQSLKVDFDSKGKSILLGVRTALPGQTGESSSPIDVPAPAMSTGTADALYLSLRLASLQHQLSHGPAIPLIVDDCLIQLDDARCVAALKTLSDFSTETQVILFTHHEHLIDLAETHLPADAFHLHRLEGLADRLAADRLAPAAPIEPLQR